MLFRLVLNSQSQVNSPASATSITGPTGVHVPGCGFLDGKSKTHSLISVEHMVVFRTHISKCEALEDGRLVSGWSLSNETITF